MNRPRILPPEFILSLTPGDFEGDDIRILADTIGAGLTAHLVYHMGGVSLYCNARKGAGYVWEQLVGLIGQDAAETTRNLFAGDVLYIPEFPLRASYDRWILRHNNGDIRETALKFGVNEGHVYRILRRAI